MIDLLIADDHAVVRRGLRQIIEAEPDMRVTGEVDSGPSVLELVRATRFDVAVLDVSMPGSSGLDVLHQVNKTCPDMRVLVLSMHPEERYAVRVLKAGANGYLTKESAPNELVHAIRKVASGGRYVSTTLAERLADEFRPGANLSAHELLSDREYQILCMIARGLTVSGIAAELNLGVNTVSTYRTRILHKLALANNAELMRYALHHQLVD